MQVWIVKGRRKLKALKVLEVGAPSTAGKATRSKLAAPLALLSEQMMPL